MTATEETPGGRVTPGERQGVIDSLCQSFASDEIDVDEFERRVDVAHRTDSPAELRSLVSDLGSQHPVVREGRTAPPVSTRTASQEQVRDRQFVVGFWSGPSRKGPWVPARTVHAVAFQGGVELDFREALLGPGVTEVRVLAFWGGVEIIVPPDLQVEFGGVGIMGGFEKGDDVPGLRDPDAPVLRITGVAVMAGAEVVMRRPGESAREARKRRRIERKERKRLGRGG